MRNIVTIPRVFGLFIALAAGCSSEVGDTSPAGNEPVGASGEAISACGSTTPRAPICNIEKCTPDGWTAWPVAAGTACSIGGRPGKCDGGEVVEGTIEPLRIGRCIPTITGSFVPKFYVLNVVYAPPGTAGSGTRSSVTYSNGSTAGSEAKTSHAFKSDVSVSAEATIAGFLTVSASSGYSVSLASDNGLEIKKTASTVLSDHGPNADGINHDDDLLYLWLNPAVDVVANGTSAQWTVSTDGSLMNIQWVSVGQLKNPSTIPQGVLDQFAARGITTADYATMLASDPFAYGAGAIDPNRFAQVSITLPYEPPLAAGEEPPTLQLTLDNETTASHTSSVESSYSVGFSVKAGTPSDFISWLSANTTSGATFTWTNSGSQTSSTTSSQSASVTMTGPSYGYTGPTDMAVYVDTLYDTFMFAPLPASASLSAAGIVKNAAGAPLVGREVVLKTATGERRTRTGPRGDYRIYDAPSGAAQLTIDGVTRAVTIGKGVVRQDLVGAL